MPTPVAHSLIGIALFQTRTVTFFKNDWLTVLFFISLANMPDLDFIPGLLKGKPNMYHQGYSHTLGAALLVGLVGGYLFGKHNGSIFRSSCIVCLAYYSHMMLDYCNQDGRFPYGVMLFWPFADTFFMAPFAFFDPVMKSASSANWLQSVLSMHNLKVAIKELVMMGPIAAGAYVLRKYFMQRAQ